MFVYAVYIITPADFILTKMNQQTDTEESNESVVITARAPSKLKCDLEEIAGWESRKIGPLITLMLQEYLPIKRIISDARPRTGDIMNISEGVSLSLVADEHGILYLKFVIGQEENIYPIDPEQVKTLSANLISYLIDAKRNG